jgi:hypothetical protein
MLFGQNVWRHAKAEVIGRGVAPCEMGFLLRFGYEIVTSHACFHDVSRPARRDY